MHFIFSGGLVLAAFDQVPWELHDNSIILGCLSFFVALVMMYDLADPLARHVSGTTQTDNMPPPQQQEQPQHHQQSVQTTPETSQSNAVVQTHETTQTTTIEKTVQPTKPVIEIVENQTKSYQSTSVDPTTPVDDIAKNGNYHKGDAIDFVQMHHMPTAEQPVFERVLLPEKKRPTFNKVADPHNSAVVHTVHYPEEYVIRESPHQRRDYIETTMPYNPMPKYAAVQRQQSAPPPPVSSHQYHDHSSSYAQPPTSSSMYKLSRSYEHNDYEHPPAKHTVPRSDVVRTPRSDAIRSPRSDAMRRYHDPAPEHYQNQPPMMFIRNYSQPMTTRTTTAQAQPQILADRRHHQVNDDSGGHRAGVNHHHHRNAGNGNRKYGAQMNNRKSTCCDDEVDFRKLVRFFNCFFLVHLS